MAIDERVLQGAASAEHIRPNLLRLRNLFHLSDTELARRSGITRQTLVNKLNGVGYFSAPELGRLAALWGVTVGRFYMPQNEFRQWVTDHEEELAAALASNTSWYSPKNRAA